MSFIKICEGHLINLNTIQRIFIDNVKCPDGKMRYSILMIDMTGDIHDLDTQRFNSREDALEKFNQIINLCEIKYINISGN